jgi:hypothetical protein
MIVSLALVKVGHRQTSPANQPPLPPKKGAGVSLFREQNIAHKKIIPEKYGSLASGTRFARLAQNRRMFHFLSGVPVPD